MFMASGSSEVSVSNTITTDSAECRSTYASATACALARVSLLSSVRSLWYIPELLSAVARSLMLVAFSALMMMDSTPT